MSVRIRKNGRIFCAAKVAEDQGDIYIDDGLHYELSAERKILVTTPFDIHIKTGEWWWKNQVPKGVIIDEFYNKP